MAKIIDPPNSNTVSFTISNLVPNSNAIFNLQNGDEIEVWILVDEWWTMVGVRNEHITVFDAVIDRHQWMKSNIYINSSNSNKTWTTSTA